MGFFSNFFGKKIDINQWVSEGAIIIDVRTKGEFASGSLKKSINIPLNTLPKELDKLNRNKAIITCCASGMRSGSAKKILKSAGFLKVHNGGSWISLKKYF